MAVGKPIQPRGAIECSCCHLLAEFVFVGKDENGDAFSAFSCSSPLCYEDTQATVEAGVSFEHKPNLAFGGGQ